MSSLTRVTRAVAAAIVAAVLLTAAAVRPGHAVPLEFDFSGNTQTTYIATGPGAFLNFSLDLGAGAGSVEGNFAMEVFDKNSTIIGAVAFNSLFGFDPGSYLGNPDATPPGIDEVMLYDFASWVLNVDPLAALTPLRIVITSTLTPVGVANFAPALKVDLDGALAFARLEQTPLPGALPLFVSGMGLLGAAAWRKRQKQAKA